ncbi:MAG: deoxyribose-phosphate aldolase [Spirochaetia bacterium]|jgi:deoxyribose-phosphate aldolase
MEEKFAISKKEFAALQDHSILGPTVRKDQVVQWCNEAIKYRFGCVYVNPCDAELAKSLLTGTNIHLGIPVGFPQGIVSTQTKIAEGLDAIEKGADELDVVINVSRLKDRDDDYVRNELNLFVRTMKQKKPDVIVKVILECPLLTREEKVRGANIIADSGAEYVKQASGSTPRFSYLIGDVKLLKKVVGSRIKIKSSGAMGESVDDALATIAFGADRVGNGCTAAWMEDFDNNSWLD